MVSITPSDIAVFGGLTYTSLKSRAIPTHPSNLVPSRDQCLSRPALKTFIDLAPSYNWLREAVPVIYCKWVPSNVSIFEFAIRIFLVCPRVHLLPGSALYSSRIGSWALSSLTNSAMSPLRRRCLREKRLVSLSRSWYGRFCGWENILVNLLCTFSNNAVCSLIYGDQTGAAYSSISQIIALSSNNPLSTVRFDIVHLMVNATLSAFPTISRGC
jgi:hypothetical protein